MGEFNPIYIYTTSGMKPVYSASSLNTSGNTLDNALGVGDFVFNGNTWDSSKGKNGFQACDTMVSYLTQLGEIFTLAVSATSPASANSINGLSLYSPGTKNILVFSAVANGQGGGADYHQLNVLKTSVNPALGNAATPLNNNIGSSVTSTCDCSYSTSTQTVQGSAYAYQSLTSYQSGELLTNNKILFIPSGTSSAVLLYMRNSTASTLWAGVIVYCEF